MKCFVLLALAISVQATNYHLKVNKLRFNKCPQFAGATLVDVGRSHVQAGQTSTSGANLKDFSFTGPGGKKESLQFPGCFSIGAQATFGTTIHNPYLEVDVSFNGMKVCEKYYKPNKYCKPTKNAKYKSTSRGTSCRFCDLCIAARKHAGKAVRKLESKVGSDTVNRVCNLAKSGITAGQSFPINLPNICVPDPATLEKHLDKAIPNWRKLRNLVKTGSILVTLHVFDRANPAPDHCLKGGGAGCDAYARNPEVGKKDKYVACYFGNIDYTLDWS